MLINVDVSLMRALANPVEHADEGHVGLPQSDGLTPGGIAAMAGEQVGPLVAVLGDDLREVGVVGRELVGQLAGRCRRLGGIGLEGLPDFLPP